MMIGDRLSHKLPDEFACGDCQLLQLPLQYRRGVPDSVGVDGATPGADADSGRGRVRDSLAQRWSGQFSVPGAFLQL